MRKGSKKVVKPVKDYTRYAIWALVAYDIFFTGMFLLVIYGNQYLVK